MREICIIALLSIVIAAGFVVGAKAVLTIININIGPYKCVDIDGNEIICEQTWRSYGTLYGITKDGKTIDLKSYECIKEEE